MTQSIPLREAADAFRVHPRTVLRIVTGELNPPWSEDNLDKPIAVEEITKTFGITAQALKAVLDGRDMLLKPPEALKILKLPERTFYKRLRKGRYGGLIRRIGRGNTIRYLRSKIIEAHIFDQPE